MAGGSVIYNLYQSACPKLVRSRQPSLQSGDWRHGFTSRKVNYSTSVGFGSRDSDEIETAAKWSLFLMACLSEAYKFYQSYLIEVP